MMYKIMKHYGLPQKVVNVIRNSYEGFKCCVKAEGEKGQMFDVKTGVRQGVVWSPILFGLVINYVLANSVQGGIDIGHCVADLDFADDVALFAKNPEPLYPLLKGTWEFLQETAKAVLALSLRPKTNPDYSLAERCWWAKRRMRAGSRH